MYYKNTVETWCYLFLRSERENKQILHSKIHHSFLPSIRNPSVTDRGRSGLRVFKRFPEVQSVPLLKLCYNGQNVWTHANGLWEQEQSQDMRRGPDPEPRSFMCVCERKTSALCRAATGGRLNFVLIMTRIKPQKCGKNFGTPSSPSCPRTFELPSGYFPLVPLNRSACHFSLSLHSISWCFVFFLLSSALLLFPPLSTRSSTPLSRHVKELKILQNGWNQPAGASDRTGEGEKL